jgi:hypothetical protein
MLDTDNSVQGTGRIASLSGVNDLGADLHKQCGHIERMLLGILIVCLGQFSSVRNNG